MAKVKVAEIKQDLLDQLERNGSMGKYYLDLVDDYMNLHTTKGKLQADIKNRGVSVKYDNGGGQTGFKKNDSIDQLLKVNQQMIKMLEYLNIKPSAKQDGDPDDEEM